jgi:hypothetical protein
MYLKFLQTKQTFLHLFYENSGWHKTVIYEFRRTWYQNNIVSKREEKTEYPNHSLTRIFSLLSFLRFDILSLYVSVTTAQIYGYS